MPDEESSRLSNGFKALTVVLALGSVIGGLYAMVELRVSAEVVRFKEVETKFEAVKDLMDLNIKELQKDLDALIKWRNTWVQRVLILDENQNGRHTASELDTTRIRKYLGMP